VLGKTFKYKLDFYYQQTLIYLVTLVLYAGTRGSFSENQFIFIIKDSILYIIALFFAVSLIVLLLNIWRGKKLVITSDRLVFHSRNIERVFEISDFEWMHIGKERLVQTAGRFQQITIKLKNRPIPLRIRVGRYERSHELVTEIENIAKNIPDRKRRRFSKKNISSFFTREI